MTTLPDLPKGAMTTTARRSKWLFAGAILVALTQVLGFAFDDEWSLIPWSRLGMLTLFVILVLLFFRSWRVLRRYEAEQ